MKSLIQNPRIISADIECDRILKIQFNDQVVKYYDAGRLLELPRFHPLREAGFFKNFQIEPGGYAIVWNEEIDVSEHELWTHGVIQKKLLTEKVGKTGVPT